MPGEANLPNCDLARMLAEPSEAASSQAVDNAPVSGAGKRTGKSIILARSISRAMSIARKCRHHNRNPHEAACYLRVLNFTNKLWGNVFEAAEGKLFVRRR